MVTDVATADDKDVAIPFGVVMVCLLQVGIGGWSALTGFALFALPSSVTSSVIGALMAFIGIVLVALAYGLWTFRPWAWGWMLIFHGLDIVFGIALLLMSRPDSSLAGIAISTGIIVYVYSKHDLYLADPS